MRHIDSIRLGEYLFGLIGNDADEDLEKIVEIIERRIVCRSSFAFGFIYLLVDLLFVDK
jgi:hypothetical protein